MAVIWQKLLVKMHKKEQQEQKTQKEQKNELVCQLLVLRTY